MNHGASKVDPELHALLTSGTIKGGIPAEIRTRALERARASLGEAPLGRRAPSLEIRRTPPHTRGRAGRLVRVALVASVAIVGAAVGAAAALKMRGAPAPAVAAPTDGRPMAPLPRAAGHQRRIEQPSPAAEPSAPAPRPVRTASRRDPFAAELVLLQRVHAAYDRRDFSAALGLVAEHARRYPEGQLAEQREALRVRSLAGSGRTDDARRAAAAFAVRFPRSVLLPRVEGSPGSSEP